MHGPSVPYSNVPDTFIPVFLNLFQGEVIKSIQHLSQVSCCSISLCYREVRNFGLHPIILNRLNPLTINLFICLFISCAKQQKLKQIYTKKKSLEFECYSRMGLLAADRKKQRWSGDPRGKSWSENKNKISNKMMEKMGWKDGEGLGADGQGMLNVSIRMVIYIKLDRSI